jgi:hypothetical protein
MDVQLFSDCYTEVESKDLFVVRATQELWSKWMQENTGDTRVFLRIFHPDGQGSFIVALGDPIQGIAENRIYMPSWMLNSNRLEGSGESVVVEAFESDSLPKATRIVLRPIESSFFDADFLPILEKVFSRMGVLQQGKQILVPIEELGGIMAELFVEKTEPEMEVYLDGDDIPLEFEQAVDYRPEALPPRAATPPLAPMMPMAPIMPMEPMAPIMPMAQGGFVPFQGSGYRLGSG